MKILFLSFVLLFAATSQGKPIEISQETLGVTISLNDSVTDQPFVSIVGISDETRQINYSDIVNGINKVIQNHTPRCFTNSCMNFQPTGAKILPYKTFLKKNKSSDLALVVRGKIQAGEESDVKTFFIPIEILLSDKKSGDSIHWFMTEGNIMSSENEQFQSVNVDRILNSSDVSQVTNPLK
jgi:hypothetical protein